MCKLLSLQFRSRVGCNDPLVVDTLASVARVVSDKTGTITENKMKSKIQMLFCDNGETILDDISLRLSSSSIPSRALRSEHKYNAITIMATSGMEPEEVAIRSHIKPYCTQVRQNMFAIIYICT